MSTLNIQLLCRRSIDFPELAYLLPDLAPLLTFIGSNYPWLEHFFMVPKVFEPLKFDCTMLKVKIGSFISSNFNASNFLLSKLAI